MTTAELASEPTYPLSVAARLAGVTQVTAQRWVHRGLIRAFRVGNDFRVTQAEVERLAALRAGTPADRPPEPLVAA